MKSFRLKNGRMFLTDAAWDDSPEVLEMIHSVFKMINFVFKIDDFSTCTQK